MTISIGRARGLATVGVAPRRYYLAASWPNMLTVAGVLIPFLLAVHGALSLPVGFDGGMNLQVAQSLAHGEGFGRSYDGWREFPPEIQTGGVFLLLAAAAIKLLGPHQLAFQCANLLFILLLLIAVSMAVRVSTVARLVAPSLVFLTLPTVGALALGGLGEIPVASLTILASILLAQAWAGSPHPYRNVALAATLVGVALTIKVVAVAALVMLAFSVVGCLVLRKDLIKRRILLAAACVVIAPAGFEAFRLGSLGWTHYTHYWSDQFDRIGVQAGLQGWENTNPQEIPDSPVSHVSALQKGLDHLHILASSTHLPVPLLLAFLLLPFLIILSMAAHERRHLRTWARQRLVALSLIIATLAVTYLAWWFFITPTERAWLRRLLIGWVAINVLYAVLLVKLTRRASTTPHRVGRQEGLRRLSTVALALIAAATAVRLGWNASGGQLANGASRELAEIEEASASVHSMQSNWTFYGHGWYSAPTMSLMADVPFKDMTRKPACTFDPKRDLLVWDTGSRILTLLTRGYSAEPWDANGKLQFSLLRNYGAVQLYRITPKTPPCVVRAQSR